MIVCPVCRNGAEMLQGHHLVPLCYGGKVDGAIADMCGTCHTGLHSYERDDREPPRHLAKFVQIVRRARAAYLNGETEARDSRRHIQLHLTPGEEATLDRIAVHFNTKGRPATLKAMLRSVASQLGVG